MLIRRIWPTGALVLTVTVCSQVAHAGVEARVRIMLPDSDAVDLIRQSNGGPSPLTTVYAADGTYWELLVDLNRLDHQDFLTLKGRHVSSEGDVLAYVIREASWDSESLPDFQDWHSPTGDHGDLQLEVRLSPMPDPAAAYEASYHRSEFAEIGKVSLLFRESRDILGVQCAGRDLSVQKKSGGVNLRPHQGVLPGDLGTYDCHLQRRQGAPQPLTVSLAWY